MDSPFDDTRTTSASMSSKQRSEITPYTRPGPRPWDGHLPVRSLDASQPIPPGIMNEPMPGGDSGQHVGSDLPSTNCNSCKARNVKCDGARPLCGNCIRLSIACIYDLDTKILPPEDSGPSRLGGLSSMFTGGWQGMILPARTNTISRLPWLGPKKPMQSIEPLEPLSHISDAFRYYIHNHVPARLIDTSKLKFVERDVIYDIFSSDIVQITDEDIQRRMNTIANRDVHPKAGIYIQRRKAALQTIFRDVMQYAIFSHRWTDTEPSYQDVFASAIFSSLTKQRSAKSAGLAKLVRLCETARKLGYRLAWSDTCCIDKTNTAELSEAIHAMFKWYAHAHVCIVHLAASSSLSDFELEPWFKRGWTLQELLAPRRIKFYDKEWRPFTALANDKEDETFMLALSTVTGIPQEVVMEDNSRGIKGRGIWEIMSWAAPRKTTRIEDTAYCLLGLFDVHLPIAYGEGEKAFPRLVEAIVARRPEWDVFAWAGQASERHPALPYSPACYPRWDETMMSGEVGMTTFTLTPHGLLLTSVPLIPMAFMLETTAKARDGEEPFVVTLRPKLNAATALGVYGDVDVVCSSGRLQHIRDTDDLHACILNYKPIQSPRGHRGRLQVGRTYVCFLLYTDGRNTEDSTWLKFAPDNVLQIACRGLPTERTSTERTSEMEEGLFDLSLKTTYIRAPRAQSTIWA